jgi:hypothetical protein
MSASESRKSAHRAACRSIGLGRARSDIQRSTQISRQLTAFNTTRRTFMSRFPFGQLAGSALLQSHISSAAFKSP